MPAPRRPATVYHLIKNKVMRSPFQETQTEIPLRILPQRHKKDRNSKHEIRNTKQIRMTKGLMSKTKELNSLGFG